jgi:hypothetical protein
VSAFAHRRAAHPRLEQPPILCAHRHRVDRGSRRRRPSSAPGPEEDFQHLGSGDQSVVSLFGGVFGHEGMVDTMYFRAARLQDATDDSALKLRMAVASGSASLRY